MEKDNPFCYIQPEDRHTLFRILYPTAEFDCLFYPEWLEGAIDDFNIPTKIGARGVYIITPYDDVKEHLEKSLKEFYQKKYEEYNKDKE